MKRIVAFVGIGLIVVYWLHHLRASLPTPVHVVRTSQLKPKPKLSLPAPVLTPKPKAMAVDTASEDVDDLNRCLQKLGKESRTEAEFYHDAKEDLERVVGPWFFMENQEGQPPPDETSAAGRFFQALGEAQLLDGRKLAPNAEHALALLRQVMQEDPGNSAPIVYAAIIERQQGDLTKYKEFVDRLRLTWHYNSYLMDFTNNLITQVRNPRDYLPALSMISRVPIPDSAELKRFLNEQPDARLAWQLTRDGRNPSNTRMDYDYMPLEYSLGQRALRAKGEDIPTLKDLYARSRNAIDETTRQLEHAGPDCSLGDLWPVLDQVKARARF
jgi:hypothetical protein